MRALLYSGYDAEGRPVRGGTGFSSTAKMKEHLDKRGITNYEIFESKTVYRQGAYRLASPKDLSIFCKQMSALFSSDITIMDSVSILAGQTENRQIKLALNEISDRMMSGHTFAGAMGMYAHIFSKYLLDALSIGELSGTLESVFSDMSVYFDKDGRTRKKLKSAITYPAVLTALMAAVITLLIIKILPMFGGILESMGTQLPPATEAILSAGSFLTSYGPAILITIAAICVAGAALTRLPALRPALDKAKLTFPGYKRIHTRVITSRFASSLSILIKSGIQTLSALEDVAAHMDNRFLQNKLMEAAAGIRGGQSLSEAITETGAFPTLFLKMMTVGEKSGRLDEMLDKAAAVFSDDADDAIERFTATLEPLLIIVLSIVVGVILLSVIFPMITIMNSVG